jgi:hypothetical protein
MDETGGTGAAGGGAKPSTVSGERAQQAEGIQAQQTAEE